MTKNVFCDSDILKNVLKFPIFSVLKIKISCAQACRSQSFITPEGVHYTTLSACMMLCSLFIVFSWSQLQSIGSNF